MRRCRVVDVQRRINRLEQRFASEPAILTMPNETTAIIPGNGSYLLRLLFCRSAPSPKQAAHLELIRQSTASNEPGGGRMIEMIRCMLQGPVRCTGGDSRT